MSGVKNSSKSTNIKFNDLIDALFDGMCASIVFGRRVKTKTTTRNGMYDDTK